MGLHDSRYGDDLFSSNRQTHDTNSLRHALMLFFRFSLRFYCSLLYLLVALYIYPLTNTLQFTDATRLACA
jgi:hypothetical protein